MQHPEKERIDYKVVLVFPGFGSERENAQEIIEAAIEHLNSEKDEPGFRFVYHVFANLEIVPDIVEAQTLLYADPTLATMILCDLPEEESHDFARECRRYGVPVCLTLPGTQEQEASERRRAKKKEPFWRVVLKKRSEDDDEPVAHRILQSVLTAPLEDDPDVIHSRVWQVIAVLALSVMDFYWTNNPPTVPD